MFALCLLLAPDEWKNEESVRKDLEVETYKDTTIAANLAMIKAHIAIVEDYVNGNLDVEKDPPPPRYLHTPFKGMLEGEQTIIAPCLIRPLLPWARGSSGEPGTASTSRPASLASRAVISEPERMAASTTTTASAEPAISLLRRGKSRARGSQP